MPVQAYMARCLYDPEHGYYRRRPAIGAAGDFVTAPEISQTFGETIGVWTMLVWRAMGRPEALQLIELGPGRGTLMDDLLRTLGTFAARGAGIKSLALRLVETNATLGALQRGRLAARIDADPAVTATWHETIDSLPADGGPTIVIANEFVDCLPVRQLVRTEAGLAERCVGLGADGRLRFVAGSPVSRAEAAAAGFPAAVLAGALADGAVIEARPDLPPLLARLATHAPLAGLVIDYGHSESAAGDTLQAVRRHRFADPLEEPGLADLTAQVDFASLARDAAEAGLAVEGPMAQGPFLMALGIGIRAERLMHSADAPTANMIETAVARLVDPAAMGVRFKVLGLRSPELPPLAPFGP
ncbi:MAG: SAM-dependent methyltransferase [Hyphomicrobiaceae bacterium]